MANDNCPGHGWNIWDSGDPPAERTVEYCGGECITDEVTDADEEPGMIR